MAQSEREIRRPALARLTIRTSVKTGLIEAHRTEGDTHRFFVAVGNASRCKSRPVGGRASYHGVVVKAGCVTFVGAFACVDPRVILFRFFLCAPEAGERP